MTLDDVGVTCMRNERVRNKKGLFIWASIQRSVSVPTLYEYTSASEGFLPFARQAFSTSKCPLAAAGVQVPFALQPFANRYFTISRCPFLAAATLSRDLSGQT